MSSIRLAVHHLGAAVVAATGLALLLLSCSPPAGAAQAITADAPVQRELQELQRLEQAKDWAALEKYSRNLLNIAEGRGGASGADVAVALTWLAKAVQNQGRAPEAEPLFRRALAIFESVYGPEHLETAKGVENLASLLNDGGHAREAEQLFRRSVAIREKLLGPEASETLESLSNLADALAWQGRNAEAEPLLRRVLASNEKTLGDAHPRVATTLKSLAEGLANQGHYAAAETLYRRALAIAERSLGAEHATTATVLQGLAQCTYDLGRLAEAERLFRRSLAIREKVMGPEHPATAQTLNGLALLLLNEARVDEAEALLRRTLAIQEKALGREHPDTLSVLNNLGTLMDMRGRYADAETLYRRVILGMNATLGAEHPATATILSNLAGALRMQGRFVEAETLLRRALAIDEKVLGAAHPRTANIVAYLANLLMDEHRPLEAEPLYRRALAINEKALGPEHPLLADSLNNLASLLSLIGRPAEAEPLARRALVIAEKAHGPENLRSAKVMTSVALSLKGQGRQKDAEPLFQRSLEAAVKALGPDHPDTRRFRNNLAFNEEALGKFAEAAANYRASCALQPGAPRSSDRNAASEANERTRISTCSLSLALSLWAVGDHSQAPMHEAFVASQRAAQSAAGDAIARSAAFTAANSAGVGTDARVYEAVLQARDALDQQYANTVADARPGRDEKLRELTAQRARALSRIAQLEAALKARAPLYWNYRAPEPLTIPELQSTQGPDASLLRPDEALISILFAPGSRRGLVFAVSKEKSAWAQLGQTGAEIQTRVRTLRSQIDPEGYGLRGIRIKPVSSTAASADATAETSNADFDRQAAYELYRALLGNDAIQSVIASKSTWLIVPSGPLTSLPPAVLVTAAPQGGKARDADPAALRATAWLLRSKAVALLPAPSALRTLRGIQPGARAPSAEPLLAFVDPEFRRASVPAATGVVAGVRALETYFRDGLPLAEALDELPALPGTRVEGDALQRALGATPDSVLSGSRASKAELFARNGDGRLSRVRVLGFATHGLVAGDVTDLVEPALALAAGTKPADALLLASEASTLRLNADWVLLSACNTASPDAPEAQGLSGLSRAFFYAGAKSLLVSHWRVRDDVAPRLIPAMLLAERKDARLSRAEALRQASLAVLDDPQLRAASPAAWAPFTLIGEAWR